MPQKSGNFCAQKAYTSWCYNAYYCGKLFKVNGSFLNYHNEYFCEQFVIAPRVFEIYKNRFNLRIGDFTLQPQNSYLFWPGVGPPLEKLIVLQNEQAFPLPLSELAYAAASRHYTKKQIMALSLPPKQKNILFQICPDKQRTCHANVRFLDPNDEYNECYCWLHKQQFLKIFKFSIRGGVGTHLAFRQKTQESSPPLALRNWDSGKTIRNCGLARLNASLIPSVLANADSNSIMKILK